MKCGRIIMSVESGRLWKELLISEVIYMKEMKKSHASGYIHTAQPDFEQNVSRLNTSSVIALLICSGGRMVIIVIVLAIRIHINLSK
jgi:hypothetical protein